MKLNDLLIDRENKFSVGIEETTGKYYVSIPVSNSYVDYEEYYEIDRQEFENYRYHVRPALEFVKQCRARQLDDRLIVQPGKIRGNPI